MISFRAMNGSPLRKRVAIAAGGAVILLGIAVVASQRDRFGADRGAQGAGSPAEHALADEIRRKSAAALRPAPAIPYHARSSAEFVEADTSEGFETSGPAAPQPEPVSEPGAGSGVPVIAPAALSPDERSALAIQARKIEQRANREVDRLTPILDLSDTQQDEIFDVLVRRSPNFDPVMVAVTPTGVPIGGDSDGGEAADPAIDKTLPNHPADSETDPNADSASTVEPVPAAEDEILESLTPEQAVRYVESEADRVMWWKEILAHLDAATPAAEPVSPADPGYGGYAGEPAPPPEAAAYGGQ